MSYKPIKYNSERDEVLHALCEDGWANTSFGDVTEYGAYFWRISNYPADVDLVNTEFSSVVEDYEIEGIDTQEFRDSLIGHFLVSEDGQGLVQVYKFPEERTLDMVYTTEEELFNVFLSSEIS